MNKFGFALADFLTAIMPARSNVDLGDSLNFSILNHALHHFYHSTCMLIISRSLKRKGVSEPFNLFVIGMALGYIADESDLLLSIGMSPDNENFNTCNPEQKS